MGGGALGGSNFQKFIHKVYVSGSLIKVFVTRPDPDSFLLKFLAFLSYLKIMMLLLSLYF